MIEGAKSRFDTRIVDGQFQALWSLRLPGVNPLWDEYMVLLYDVKSESELPIIRYRDDVSHEVVVVAMGVDVKVDYDRSLFEQSELQPLTPPNHGYQFKAADNLSATKRVEVCVNSILNGSLSPDSEGAHVWEMLFSDGVKLCPA